MKPIYGDTPAAMQKAFFKILGGMGEENCENILHPKCKGENVLFFIFF